MDYLDSNPLRKCLEKSSNVMVYGWSHCHYEDLAEQYKATMKVFDFNTGEPDNISFQQLLTHEGRIFEQVPLKPQDDKYSTKAICKAAITNLVLENYKRQFLELPVIPLIFVLDTEKNPYPCSSESINSREDDHVTNSEIRRCYRHIKLAETLKIPELVKATQESFYFVKSVPNEHGCFELKSVAAPWDAADWASQWEHRKFSRIHIRREKDPLYRWRDYFKRAFSADEDVIRNEMKKKEVARAVVDCYHTSYKSNTPEPHKLFHVAPRGQMRRLGLTARRIPYRKSKLGSWIQKKVRSDSPQNLRCFLNDFLDIDPNLRIACELFDLNEILSEEI